MGLALSGTLDMKACFENSGAGLKHTHDWEGWWLMVGAGGGGAGRGLGVGLVL